MKDVTVSGLSVELPRADGEPLQVLDAVDMHVEAGEFVSIVGPSGCGKSTLLNVVGGLVSPTSGDVHVGADRVEAPSASRGMVFQSYSLFEWRTVRGNVEFGLEVAGIRRDERREQAERLIGLVGLRGFEDAYPRGLSGGMQQRVALARSLATQPEVLLLDEPFGALDAQTRGQMQELLLSVWNQVRTTIVFVTHDLDEAIFLSDRVYVMSRRPGRWRTVVTVDLPRPRSYEVTVTLEFGEHKARLLGLLREESLAAARERDAANTNALIAGAHSKEVH